MLNKFAEQWYQYNSLTINEFYFIASAISAAMLYLFVYRGLILPERQAKIDNDASVLNQRIVDERNKH